MRVYLREIHAFYIILGEAASYDGSPYNVPFAGPPMVSGIHEAINIITERERVGIIIADDRKNDYRKRDVEEQESEEEKETRKGREEDGEKEAAVVSSSKSTFIHSTWGGSSITRGFEIFGSLPTAPGITLEIDVARPRNLGAVQTARFFSPALVRLSSFFPTAERRRGNIFIILAVTPGSGSWDPRVRRHEAHGEESSKD